MNESKGTGPDDETEIGITTDSEADTEIGIDTQAPTVAPVPDSTEDEPEPEPKSEEVEPEPEEPEPEPEPEEQAEPASTAPVIELKDLSIYVPGKFLLIGVNLKIAQGERVLLVGPSGAGKTVLLKLLTGLLPLGGEIAVTGDAQIQGHSVVGGWREKRQAQQAVGIVFQDHALLDELSAKGNLLFARDHAASKRAGEATERALEFLEEHEINPHARVATLSGGQKQRVAVARALARDPQVVFYDEPTASLDPRNAKAVAELIHEAGESFSKTSVVVTHNYAPFQEFATRILYLDQEKKRLREIPWEELDAIMEAPAPLVREPKQEQQPLRRAMERITKGAGDFLAATPAALLMCVLALFVGLIPIGARMKWFGRWLWHYCRIVFLGTALPYNIIAGVIAGFVATYFTFEFLPRPDLTEPLIMDDILPALGFALYRIIVPVLVTILVAGRTGAALASDFGTRVYHHQIEAMDSMGAPTRVYLGTAALWASLIGIVVVGIIAFWAACLTSVSVYITIKPEMTPFYWSDFFWRHIEPFEYGVMGKGWEWVLFKLLLSGAGVCAIAYFFGTRPKESTADVSRGITLTVYWSTVFVLLVHFITAFFEFVRPMG